MNFNNKARKYDSVSFPQMELSEELFQLSLDYLPEKPPAILDIGCGTGHLTLDLASLFPKSLNCVDISPEMLEVCKEKLQEYFPKGKWNLFLSDAENFTPNLKYDAVYCSAAVQWFSDILKFLAKIKKWLTPNGIIAFGAFGKKTLCELRAAYFEATGRRLENKAKFFLQNEFENIFEKAGFEILDSASCIYNQEFNSPIEALKALRDMGVTTTSEKPLSRQELQKFKECLAKGNGVGKNGKKNAVIFSWELFVLIACVSDKSK